MLNKFSRFTFTVLLFFSSFRLTTLYNLGGITIVYLLLFMMLLFVFFYKRIRIKFNSFSVLTFYIFCLFALFSSLLASDSGILFRSVVFLIMFLSTNIFIPSYYKERTKEVVVRAILVSQLPLALLSFWQAGFPSAPYRGVFGNANQLASVSATVLVVFVAITFKRFEDKLVRVNTEQTKSPLVPLIFVGALMFLITTTTSRTSFLTSVAVIMVATSLLVLNLFKKKKKKKLISLFKRSFRLLPPAFILYFLSNRFFPLNEAIEANILSKFERKSGATFSGRDAIWSETINRVGFFGGGSDFFVETVGISSHNTFLQILGNFGWIPMILFVFFLLYALYKSVKLYFKDDGKYKYITPLMLTAFFTLSMGEDLHYQLIMIVILVLSGDALNNKHFKLIVW